jgi:hypothetical protein
MPCAVILLSHLDKLNFDRTSYWKELFHVTHILYLKVLSFRFKQESLKNDIGYIKTEAKDIILSFLFFSSSPPRLLFLHKIEISTFWMQKTKWQKNNCYYSARLTESKDNRKVLDRITDVKMRNRHMVRPYLLFSRIFPLLGHPDVSSAVHHL